MPSTYSPSLKLELIASGEQSGTWGATTNTNLGTLIEQAITGVQSISMSNSTYTLSDYNGVSDEARNAVLVLTGALNASQNVIIPSVNKLYVVYNNTSGGYPVVIKTSAGTGFSVANGVKQLVYCDGSTVYNVNPNITATTGSEIVPVGTTAQRDGLPSIGFFRFNSTINSFEGVKQFAGATIVSITKSAGTTTATLTTATNHGLSTNDIVIITGATDILYNGEFLITKVSDVVFTYSMTSEPAANATVVGSYVYLLWGSVGGGATGGGGNDVFYENSQVVTSSYTITTSKNAMSTGPITINSGIVVTVPTGSRWVVL
jgi:hypothetical protein